MRVLYDIGVFAFPPPAGVWRVAEQVARRLASFPDCELTFCTSGTTALRLAARQYVRSDERLGRVPILPSEPVREWMAESSVRLTAQDRSPFAARVGGYFLARAGADSTRRIPFEEFDIFHSPFHALPKRAKQTKRLRRFLTVHDLCQVLMPRVVRQDGYVREHVNSAGPEDWVICVSGSTRTQLLNYRNDLDESRVIVIHSAADGRFRPCTDASVIAEVRKRYAIGDAPYFLCLCTLEPRKNLEQTVRAFARLLRQEATPDLRLVLAGEAGWEYEPLLKMIADDGLLQKRVVRTGFVTDEDANALYSGAVAFVFPSWCEGFGLPVAEAMQCGAPVITSNTSAMPEIVGDAGIMVDPADADALCEAMLRVYRSESLRLCMSRKSLQRSTHFSWDKCAQAVMAAYQTAMKA
jgi:glycosyltransferase involved in cell wall biosynthesis